MRNDDTRFSVVIVLRVAGGAAMFHSISQVIGTDLVCRIFGCA